MTENYWPFIFVIAAIALAVGPVMMMQPSQRMRRLTALRQTAAQRGIRVRLDNVTFASEKKQCAVYSIVLPQETGKNSEQVSWVLIKKDYAHDVNFYGEWDWLNPKSTAPVSWYSSLKKTIDQLEDSIIGIEANTLSIGVYWKEQHLSIDEIEQLLIDCREQWGA